MRCGVVVRVWMMLVLVNWGFVLMAGCGMFWVCWI